VNSLIQDNDEDRCFARKKMPVLLRCIAQLGCIVRLLIEPAGALATHVVSVNYERDVKPILAEHCFACHGALRQASGLRLDAVQLIRKGGDRGPSVSPGASKESTLIAAVRGTGDISRMPPEDDGTPLREEEIAILENWIQQGAESPDEPIPPDPRSHWAWQIPVRPKVPKVRDSEWQHHPIDAFLAATYERSAVVPVPPASREVLLRRVYFDLVGLPPTRDELHDFLNDSSDGGYDRVVDQLLLTPQYGERWARHWMDVWRYTDWSGLENKMRHSQKHIWRWRDWIVESLNHDKGYDRMILEMLAGDELEPGNADTARATGFLARNWYLYNRNVWLDDMIEHTAKGFLGVTLNCAKCHEHKYDPISHEDYYSFRAFFEPHSVRLDQVGREKDLEKDGLPRVYDADPQAVTYRFIRGEETRPDKDHPHQPAIPEVLGSVEGTIQPVHLPLAAWYPALSPDAREAAIAESEAAVESAEEALEHVKRQFPDSAGRFDSAADDEDFRTDQNRYPAVAINAPFKAQQLAAAEAKAVAAREERKALQAVLNADLAKYCESNHTDAELETLSKAAGDARHLALIRRAEADLIVAQNALAVAGISPDSDIQKAEAAIMAAQTIVEQKSKELETLKSLPDKQQPMVEVHAGKVYPSTSTGRRLALARWIAGRNNPLTARVAVNHIWTRLCGSPLVDSMFDFGLRTKQPVNHELLDWLAVELMEHSWSLKHLHRLIVTSRAYRMQSEAISELNSGPEIDPDNRLLWRMNARRMESEVVRDTLIYLTGRLDLTMGGPDLPIVQGDEGTRRTIYYKYSRDEQVRFIRMFNPASVEECYRRQHSIDPQQALAMSNSGMVLKSAQQLNARIIAEIESGTSEFDPDTFIGLAYEHVLNRRPTPAERTICAAAFAEFVTAAATDSGESTAAEHRACENLVHLLINHNDFITIR
jgi:hypothetical protein